MVWYALALVSFAVVAAWTWKTRGASAPAIQHDDDVEALLRARLGVPAVAELDDLARHHAFDMLVRGYDGEVDPDGEDLAARARRLTPRLLLRARELDARASWPLRPTPQEVAAALADALGPLQAQVAGVGVAQDGRTWTACVVAGDVLGRLRDVRRRPPPGFGVEVEVADADPALRLALRAADGAVGETVAARDGVLRAEAATAPSGWVLLDGVRPLLDGPAP